MNNYQKLKIVSPTATVTPMMYNALLDALSIGKTQTLGMTAKAGGQAKAAKLMSDMNTVDVVAVPGNGVKLPDAVRGMSLTVENKGIHPMRVYPYETDRINELNANAYHEMLPGDMHVYNSVDSTRWISSNLRGPMGNQGLTGLQGPITPLTTPSAHTLGIAEPFAILTGGAVTVSNEQLVISTGNIGQTSLVNPGKLTLVSGTNQAVSAAAVAVANTFYNTMSEMTADFTFGATNLEAVNAGYGVKRFVPGVYRGTTDITTSASQTITLVGDGDYIFISDSAITFGADTIIELKSGAQASRVYWLAAGAITTGANNVLKGNFITPAAINVGATNEIDGRLMSTLSAAITIDGTATNLGLHMHTL